MLTNTTLAQDIKGVAFVSAPEQSSGVCFADNADKGFQCVRSKCAYDETPRSECLRVKWCYPAGWSADIFLQNKEGLHWHHYLCVWSSRGEVEAAVKLICEGNQKRG